jgi:hypothetical protein
MYDKNKNYKWDTDSQFSFSGAEFGMILNTFRAILSTEQAAQILLVDRANSIMEEKMKQYVESGIIKEYKENESKENFSESNK